MAAASAAAVRGRSFSCHKLNFLLEPTLPFGRESMAVSDIEPGLEGLPAIERSPVAVREGLPPAYRMRADAHYVEQLDSAPSSPSVRLIDARTIEVRGDEPRPAPTFVDSIKRHGVLQPILVQTRGGRYRLIAGRKRLAAAMAAGLREVPCLVQRVDEEQAGLMAEATNLPAQEQAAPGRPAAATVGRPNVAPAPPNSWPSRCWRSRRRPICFRADPL